MKIILIGASGTIGRRIAAAVEKDHELVRVGSKSGDFRVDIGSTESIEKLYWDVGPFDTLINAAGSGHFGPLHAMTAEDFRKGLDSKLLGQVNLVLIGQHHIRPKGSFTLTSGILAEDPVPYGANLSAVNAAVEAFGRAAAIELENGVRINVVSPGVVEDSPGYFPFFPGHIPVPMEKVAAAYVKSALGAQTGQVFKVY
ncbi:short chain dehydrogenase [Puia sp.]|jgi:NAD(P)-dependent dehydrogenase (short-subunit alcohol dehydrogenase family)|uniref:short chain dehydrogenase n=1 Tax=Puia sp. TaxID=2045100 RepID=UPI002F412E19